MSSVHNETTITLDEAEKEILVKAIELCESIASDCDSNSDLYVDAEVVFSCIHANYSQGKLPTVIYID